MANPFAETRNGNVALIWLNCPKQFNALESGPINFPERRRAA